MFNAVVTAEGRADGIAEATASGREAGPLARAAALTGFAEPRRAMVASTEIGPAAVDLAGIEGVGKRCGGRVQHVGIPVNRVVTGRMVG